MWEMIAADLYFSPNRTFDNPITKCFTPEKALLRNAKALKGPYHIF